MNIGRDSYVVKNVSYLRARDPSILAFNRTGLANARLNLGPDLEISTPTSHITQSDNLQIYLRIKKAPEFEELYEVTNDILLCKIPEGSNVLRNVKQGDSITKSFTFSKIFGPETSQVKIFNDVVKPKMFDFLSGKNSTLLTYGVSGSGKTFTVIGTVNDPGLVPRALEYLFKTVQVSALPSVKPLPCGDINILDEVECKKEKMTCKQLLNSYNIANKAQHSKTYAAMQHRLSNEPTAYIDNAADVTCEVWVSFAEIYNEYIYDLLQPDPGRGKQRPKLRLGCSNNSTYIKNLTCISVSSGLEAFQIMQYGIQNLNYAATNLNHHSSRSHSIFIIKLVQISKSDNGVYISNFHFCDLAGSERLKKTMNVGDRLKESNNINNSLLVLGRCISAIKNSQKQSDNKLVPFRESKLTQLFQRALAGYEDISMIVNISPSRNMFDETQHVLNFSAIAKDITIQSQPVHSVKTNRFSQFMQSQDRKLTRLEEEEESEAGQYQCRDIIEYLENELEMRKVEYEESVKLNCDRLHTGYKELLQDKDKFWQRRMLEQEESLKANYNEKIRSIKCAYEQKLKEVRLQNEVINLESSDDEEEEEEKEIRATVAMKILHKKMEDLENEIKLSRENVEKLMSTLLDAQNEYRTLEHEKRELEKTVVVLKDRIEELEREVAIVRSEVMFNDEERCSSQESLVGDQIE